MNFGLNCQKKRFFFVAVGFNSFVLNKNSKNVAESKTVRRKRCQFLIISLYFSLSWLVSLSCKSF